MSPHQIKARNLCRFLALIYLLIEKNYFGFLENNPMIFSLTPVKE